MPGQVQHVLVARGIPILERALGLPRVLVRTNPTPSVGAGMRVFFYSPSLSNATQTPCGTERAPVFPKTNSSNKQGLYADLLDWWLRVFDHDQFTVFAFDLYKRDPDRVEDLVLSNLHLLKNMYVKYTRES